MAYSDYSGAQYWMVEPYAGAPSQPMSSTGTSKQFALGMTVRAVDRQFGLTTAGSVSTAGTFNPGTNSTYNLGAGEFVYCQGSNVASRGQFVHIINNSAVLLASANSASFYPIGLAAGPMTATNVYGWVQVAGLADYATCSNTNIGAGVRIAFGSTAGQVGTVTALGSRIHGIIAPASYDNARTASAPNATVQLNHPFAIGITGSN